MKIRKVKVVGLLATVMATSFATGLGMLSKDVSAETTTGSYYLLGANVSILKAETEDKSAYFSLDYTAVVDNAFYENNLKGKDYALGIVIAPEKGEAITVETTNVANICYVGSDVQAEGITAIPNFDNGTYSFTASIVYNSATLIAEYKAFKPETTLTDAEILQKAANVELTARPYYKVGNEIEYCGSTVTRSVKNILNEVNLRGAAETGITLSSGIINEFVGTTTLKDDGDYYLDASTGELLKFADGELSNVSKDNNAKYVLAGKSVDIDAEASNVTFDVADIPDAVGKVRGVTLVNSGETTNIKATIVTDVFRTETELKNGINYTASKVDNKWTGTTKTGYYLLGNDIKLTSNFTNYTVYAGDFGFAGTLNGLGYSIDCNGYKLQNGGLFGKLIDGAVAQNFALLNVDLNAGNLMRTALASRVENSNVENLYIQMKEIETTTSGYTTYGNNPGGVLVGSTEVNSTFKNIVLDVPYEYTNVGNTSKTYLGAMPVFGPTVSTPSITNVYLIGKMPYNVTFKDGTVAMEFAPNVTNGSEVEFGTEYDIATVLGGNNELLKKFATIAQTMYPETLADGNPEGYVPASKFKLTNNFANENSYGQYETLAALASANVSNAFADSKYWATNDAGYLFWHSQENKYYEENATTWDGEFYIENATGNLLYANAQGVLTTVAQSQFGANISKVVLGVNEVSFATGANATFATNDLAALSIGEKVTITVLTRGGATKLEATNITKALSVASDFSVFTSDSNGYYVLADSVDLKDYAHSADGKTFSGVFDGRGFSITNYVASTNGLFGNIKGTSEKYAEFKNVAVKDFSFSVWGNNRGLLGANMHYTKLQNVYISYVTGTGKNSGTQFGGILTSCSASNNSTHDNKFDRVIIENKADVATDAIGLFGRGNYSNTFVDSYFISNTAQMILVSGANVNLILGKNSALVEADKTYATNYSISEVIANTAGTYTATMVKYANIAKAVLQTNTTVTTFSAGYPGGNKNNKTHLIEQRFERDEMEGGTYTSFTSYWTLDADGIPVWAK